MRRNGGVFDEVVPVERWVAMTVQRWVVVTVQCWVVVTVQRWVVVTVQRWVAVVPLLCEPAAGLAPPHGHR